MLWRPVESPIVFEACPSPGYRTSLYLGALPDAAAEAVNTGVALSELAVKLAILSAIDKSRLLAPTAYSWYTTVKIEREVEVDRLDARRVAG